MSRRFWTSDPHYFHDNVLKFCPQRPWKTVGEMNEGLIKNWNEIVRKGDVVYVLGDFSFGTVEETKGILRRLNGSKLLVKGNHDRNANVMIEMGFTNVAENEMINIDGQKVLMSHFPYYPTIWSRLKAYFKGQELDIRYLHKRIVDSGLPLLHGHVHQHYRTKDKMLNVGVDVNQMRPVSEEEMVKWLRALK